MNGYRSASRTLHTKRQNMSALVQNHLISEGDWQLATCRILEYGGTTAIKLTKVITNYSKFRVVSECNRLYFVDLLRRPNSALCYPLSFITHHFASLCWPAILNFDIRSTFMVDFHFLPSSLDSLPVRPHPHIHIKYIRVVLCHGMMGISLSMCNICIGHIWTNRKAKGAADENGIGNSNRMRFGPSLCQLCTENFSTCMCVCVGFFSLNGS